MTDSQRLKATGNDQAQVKPELDKLKRMSEELKCTICTAILEDPHATQCGHVYCGTCIYEWYKAKKICPLCKTPGIRRPVHVVVLQKIIDILRPNKEGPEERVTPEQWKFLYPMENNTSFMRDEDEDGVVHRCSQCGWELDEQNYCLRCHVSFDGDLPTDQSHSEVDTYDEDEGLDEEDLEDFVVDDDHVEFDDMDDDHLTNHDSTDNEDDRSNTHAIEINDSDDDRYDEEPSQPKKRKRIVNISSEDESNNSGSEGENNNIDYFDRHVDTEYNDHSFSNEEDYSDGEEYGVEFENDPFDRRPKRVAKFIDDYADESDIEELEYTHRPAPVDKLSELIKAKAAAARAKANDQTESNSSSSSDDSSDSDSEPDYAGLGAPSTEAKTFNKADSSQIESSSSKKKGKQPEKSNAKQESSSLKSDIKQKDSKGSKSGKKNKDRKKKNKKKAKTSAK